MNEAPPRICDRLLYRSMRELDEHISELRSMSRYLADQIENKDRSGGRLTPSGETLELVRTAYIAIGQSLKMRRDELNDMFDQLGSIDEVNYPDPRQRAQADRQRALLYQVRDKQQPELEDILGELRQRIIDRNRGR